MWEIVKELKPGTKYSGWQCWECNTQHIEGVRCEFGWRNISWLHFCWSLALGPASPSLCHTPSSQMCVSLWVHRWAEQLLVGRWGRRANRWAKPVWHRAFSTLGGSKNKTKDNKKYVLWILISANLLSHLLCAIKLLVNLDTHCKLLISI